MPNAYTPSSYEQLGNRVQKILAEATFKQRYQVTLTPRPDDAQEDWDRLIEEFQTHENVGITPMDTGEYLVTWNPDEAV